MVNAGGTCRHYDVFRLTYHDLKSSLSSTCGEGRYAFPGLVCVSWPKRGSFSGLTVLVPGSWLPLVSVRGRGVILRPEILRSPELISKIQTPFDFSFFFLEEAKIKVLGAQ